jgi:glycosyltransferase involved in cell wall biosynthesis
MSETINVIEPTLVTEAGHCYSFIRSFCQGSHGSGEIILWAGRHADLNFADTNIRIAKYFFRRIRRLQSYFLYRKLLAKPGKLFITTAGRTDLLLLDWASRGKIPSEKVYLYFHWFNSDEKKLATLKEIARKQPNLIILGPTPSVANLLQNAGFINARVVPYPILKQEMGTQAEPNRFRHLLYAGAARRDKGFSQVVDLVAYLQEQGLQIPVTLQISPEHYGKYDAAILSDIHRLQAISYPHLQLCPETLEANQYTDLFAGAICLQLYDPSDFADRISGVTLDAFSAGSPIVATAGTWIARMAQRFDAGVVVQDTSPAQILCAAQHVISGYGNYNQNARAAGKALQEENSAEVLFKVLQCGR